MRCHEPNWDQYLISQTKIKLPKYAWLVTGEWVWISSLGNKYSKLDLILHRNWWIDSQKSGYIIILGIHHKYVCIFKHMLIARKSASQSPHKLGALLHGYNAEKINISIQSDGLFPWKCRGKSHKESSSSCCVCLSICQTNQQWMSNILPLHFSFLSWFIR